MMTLYEFIDECKANGLTSAEALDEWDRARSEATETFLENYSNNPEVQYGWYQHDMRRREK